METKSRRCIFQAGTVVAGHDQLGNPSVSLQKRYLQVGSAVNPAASLRVPVVPQNRTQLKAMRQAELRAWKSVGADRTASEVTGKSSTRLASHDGNVAEDRVYAILTLLCGLTLLVQTKSIVHTAPGWQGFVDFVRQLISQATQIS